MAQQSHIRWVAQDYFRDPCRVLVKALPNCTASTSTASKTEEGRGSTTPIRFRLKPPSSCAHPPDVVVQELPVPARGQVAAALRQQASGRGRSAWPSRSVARRRPAPPWGSPAEAPSAAGTRLASGG